MKKSRVMELCRKYDICITTFYTYLREGKIKATKHPLTGRYTIDETSLIELMKRVKGGDR